VITAVCAGPDYLMTTNPALIAISRAMAREIAIKLNEQRMCGRP
jgi:hypothetical protein